MIRLPVSLRYIVGLAVSAIFIVLTVLRTDIPAVTSALLAAAPAGLALAVALVVLEVAVRGYRWRTLLVPLRPVTYRLALAYLCVGYFANTFLPARLGDVARAHLAGTALRVPRLATLGTIAVERVADASLIVLVVVGLGIATPAARDLILTGMVIGMVVGSIGLAALGLLILVRRGRFGGRAPVRLLSGFLRGVLGGVAAVRSPVTLAEVAALTGVAFAIAVAGYALVAASVGLELTLVEAAIVMGVLALSTSIPAAPGSVGTYEFVGLTTLTYMGAPADAALASVVLIHVIAALPPAIGGLVATWVLHIKVSDVPATPIASDLPEAG